jgi:hypothetical protein
VIVAIIWSQRIRKIRKKYFDMKKVKITIEVEVKDEAKFVAVESDGTVYSFGEFPHPSLHGSYFEVEDDVFCESARVSNWYETVTEVNSDCIYKDEAIMHDLEPRFLDAPKEWISERDGLVCSNEDLKISFFDSELSALVVFNRKVANSSSF